MAYPASQLSLADTLSIINRTVVAAKSHAQAFNAQSLAGPVSRVSVLELQKVIASASSRIQTLQATPGLAQYARDQLNNQAIDVVAEFTAMRAAMNTLRDWITTNFPRDPATQAVLIQTCDGEGVISNLTFTTAQLLALRVEVSAFIATVG